MLMIMNRKPRRVPSWLENTTKKTSKDVAKLAFTTRPKMVVYVMSPKELQQVAESVLNEESPQCDDSTTCQDATGE